MDTEISEITRLERELERRDAALRNALDVVLDALERPLLELVVEALEDEETGAALADALDQVLDAWHAARADDDEDDRNGNLVVTMTLQRPVPIEHDGETLKLTLVDVPGNTKTAKLLIQAPHSFVVHR